MLHFSKYRIIVTKRLVNKFKLLENTSVRITFDIVSNITRRVLVSFLLFFISFLCFADDIEAQTSTIQTSTTQNSITQNSITQTSINVALPANFNLQSQILPMDAKIGSIVQANATVYHTFLYSALSCEYSFEWIDKYISTSSQKVISEIYGTYLAENLPFKEFLMSSMFENANKSISINVHNGEDVFCFVIENVSNNSSNSNSIDFISNDESPDDSNSETSLYDNLRISVIRQL